MNKRKKNPWIEILANIILPSYILSKLTEPLGATKALILALSLPAGYFTWEFLKEKKINYLSLFGLINTLFRGLLAIFELGGIWFVINEAIFPLILFAFVLISAFSEKPFIKWMLTESGAFNFSRLENLAKENNTFDDFTKLQKKTTLWFSMTLLFSAIVNLVIALFVFKDIPEVIEKTERAKMLNDQIAQMTLWGWVGITIPSLLALGFLFYYYFKKTSQYTNTSIEELMRP